MVDSADRAAGSVGVVINAEGAARFQGLAHCGSVWECPTCQMLIKSTRAGEVSYAVESHGRQRVALLSLTLAHGMGDDLKEIRAGLSNAWRRTIRGSPWRRFKERLGVWGTVRALEVTHGPNGWHPHLHILLLLKDEIPPAELGQLDGDAVWRPHGDTSGFQWLVERWGDAVETELGASARPSDRRGVDLRPCSSSNYITKLGLEISDPGIKLGRHLNRNPLHIAYDFVTHGRRRDAGLWQAYCRGMKGARFLTWSRGLKRDLGIVERPDAEISVDEEIGTTDIVVGAIPAHSWAELRGALMNTNTATNVDGTTQPRGIISAGYWVLEQVERRGTKALRWALLQLASGEVRTWTDRDVALKKKARKQLDSVSSSGY